MGEPWVRITIAEHERTGEKALVFSQEAFLEHTRSVIDDWEFHSAEMPLSAALDIGPTVREAWERGDLVPIEEPK